MALSLEAIRSIASRHGYEEVQFNETSRVIAFEKNTSNGGSVRFNIYYTTGTVATCLDHPRSGKTQLFRRDQDIDDVDTLFADPRFHSGVGYYRR
ncbi:hypothetical protein CTEN210_14333 [Chaetoceros tenuissimus]|uniref:Uncharacterized protein n=1 Tax=Chaetoceros tenuissimus TaxID=426638 RepID=A0AAD3HBN2_9STRA|nr:hypothetical protein CTEN210_14333 [Chaetoceros tenuissimus]